MDESNDGGEGEQTPVDKERIEAVLQIWKTNIEVQRHFNDVAIGVRKLAVSTLGAFVALAVFAIKEKVTLQLFGAQVPSATVLLFAATFLIIPYYIIDRWWYHELLIDAVDLNEQLESRWVNVLPDIGTSTSIRKRHSPKCSRRVISIFYLLQLVVLLVFGGVLWCSGT